MMDTDAMAELVRSNPCLFCQQRDTFNVEWITETESDWEDSAVTVTYTMIVTCRACEARAVRRF